MICIISDTRFASNIAGDTKWAIRRMPNIKPAFEQVRMPCISGAVRGRPHDRTLPAQRSPSRRRMPGCGHASPSTPEPAGERPPAPGPHQPCAMDRLEAVSPQRQLLADSGRMRPHGACILTGSYMTFSRRSVRQLLLVACHHRSQHATRLRHAVRQCRNLPTGAMRYGKQFTTRREAMDEAMDWLTFYNHRRLHSTLRHVSPMAFEQR